MKEKIKITPEQFGKVLFTFVYKIAYDESRNKKLLLKPLDIQKKDKNYLTLEMLAALFFLVISQLEESFSTENLEKKVFDSMHESLYLGLELDEDRKKYFKIHFASRYKEYQDAMKEKRGPNWMWPLTNHILNNLRREETKDIWMTMHLTTFLFSIIEQILNLRGKYEITENENNP